MLLISQNRQGFSFFVWVIKDSCSWGYVHFPDVKARFLENSHEISVRRVKHFFKASENYQEYNLFLLALSLTMAKYFIDCYHIYDASLKYATYA